MKLEIPYHDLRSWFAGEIDEIRRAEGASWQEEIGMAAELRDATLRLERQISPVNMPSPESARRVREKFSYLLDNQR